MEWIPQYIANKHGRTKPKYLHPKLEPILAETYGSPCYQEQVMQIARDIAGFTMGEADELRKVMGKKQKEKIPVLPREVRRRARSRRRDRPRSSPRTIFAFIEPFAGYGFNKSHAAAYGWIAYQTAYLKANHPLQYLAALMTSVKDKTDKLVEYIDEAKKVGIDVLPPDVNESLVDFAVVGESDSLRSGGGQRRRRRRGAQHHRRRASDDGRFTDLFDLAKRVDAKQVNRRVFEALIKCGALDALPGNRAQKLAALDRRSIWRRARRAKPSSGSLALRRCGRHAPSLAPKLPTVAAPTHARDAGVGEGANANQSRSWKWLIKPLVKFPPPGSTTPVWSTWTPCNPGATQRPIPGGLGGLHRLNPPHRQYHHLPGGPCISNSNRPSCRVRREMLTIKLVRVTATEVEEVMDGHCPESKNRECLPTAPDPALAGYRSSKRG